MFFTEVFHMKRIPTMKRIASILLLCCMLASMLPVTAYGTPSVRDGEVVKQGTLVASEDGMVTVQETIAHTSGNNFDVTMTVTTSDLVEIEPVRPAHIVLCIDRSNSMDGDRRTSTPSTPTNPAPYNVLQRSPKTGDNSDTWLYIFAGAALALFLLFVVPIIPSRPEEGGRYRGSRRKK